MTDIQYIDTNKRLAEFCGLLEAAEFIAVDTEFAREKTYFPKLCLLQIASPDHLACIDPFEIDDFEPMLNLFRNKDLTKVLHSLGQDMEVFLHTFNCLPDPIYDTQIAASLAGMGEQVGYAKLVNEMLGVELDKSHTRTDWSRRPLDEAQIQYAADDVRYLAELYPRQRKQLEAQGRLQWVESDFAEVVRPERYQPDPTNVWKRVKGNARLRGVELAILQVLAQYREERAIKSNRPRRFIIGDDQLLDLARSKPTTIKDIERRRGFSAGLINRHGQAMLDCVEKGMAVPKENWPEASRGKPLSAQQEVLADILLALLKQQAKSFDLSPGLLANRRDIERLVRGKRDIPLMQGWRFEHGGRALVEFLDGEVTLKYSNNQLVLTKKK